MDGGSSENRIPEKKKAGRFRVRPSITFAFIRNSSWERQIGPQIVEVAWWRAIGRIVALANESPDESPRIRLRPDCGSSASAFDVIHKGCALSIRYGLGRIDAVLVGIADSLPPNPQPGALLVLPDVVQESSGVRGAGAISPAPNQPEIAAGIAPPNGSPT